MRGPGETRTPIASRLRLKVGCITFLPRARRAAGGDAFELRRHRVPSVFVRWERSESNRDGAQGTRGLQPRPEPRRSALPSPENEKSRRGSFPGRLQIVSACGQPSLRVWSLPFVGRGTRLALDTHDGPLAGEIRLAVPIAPRAYVSHDALAPCDSRGCGCERHGIELCEQNASAAARGCQRSDECRRFARDLLPRYRATL